MSEIFWATLREMIRLRNLIPLLMAGLVLTVILELSDLFMDQANLTDPLPRIIVHIFIMYQFFKRANWITTQFQILMFKPLPAKDEDGTE